MIQRNLHKSLIFFSSDEPYISFYYILVEGTAGDQIQLTCRVVTIPGLVVNPTVWWTGHNMSDHTVSQSETTVSGTVSVRNLTFTSLRTSHGGRNHHCLGQIEIPSIEYSRTRFYYSYLRVKSKYIGS